MQIICSNAGNRLFTGVPDCVPWLLTSVRSADNNSVELMLQIGGDIRLTLMSSETILRHHKNITLENVNEAFEEVIETVRQVFEADNPKVLDLESIQLKTLSDWEEAWSEAENIDSVQTPKCEVSKGYDSKYYVWSCVIKYLESIIGAATVQSWFGYVDVLEINESAIILQATSFKKRLLETECAELIADALHEKFHMNCRVFILADDEKIELRGKMYPKLFSSSYTWAKILGYMMNRLGETTIASWFNDAEVLELTAEHLLISSSSSFRCEIIQKRCSDYIHAALKELFDLELDFSIRNDGTNEEKHSYEYEETELAMLMGRVGHLEP